ncbi:MAG: heavy metal translocating P-type ATPase [Clostridia bacterium]|nr:heavy metal translocating P-type ATPase [Clostridia bacterium]
MNDYTLQLTGLDCANCARELEEELERIPGVDRAAVDFMGQKARLVCSPEALKEVKDCCNHFEDVQVVGDTAQVPTGPRVEKLKVKDLCCANCCRILEGDLNKLEGVEASVDFVNEQIMLKTANDNARAQAIYTITHFEDVKIVSGNHHKVSLAKEHKWDIVWIIVSVVFFIPPLVMDLVGLDDRSLALKIVIYCLYGVAYLAAGWKVLVKTGKNISKGKIFDENFLMTIASLGAIVLGILEGDGFFEGVAVMLLYSVGELLQAIAVGSSRSSIAALMDLKSEHATLLVNGEQHIVAPEELHEGDIILIKAGEKVPVDCRITDGASSLDLKSLNGEPAPKDVKEGDDILSGSINLSGVLEAVVVREYKDSAVAKILELVENSSANKSKSEQFITKFAKYYTPIVCALAVIIAVLVPTIVCGVSADGFIWETYRQWIYTGLNFLVISCPCALVISVPLTYFCGIGACARLGILIKGATSLDALALAKVAAFDKTGTLTEGTFTITDYTDNRTLELAAAAEKFSTHPIAVAFKDISTRFTVDDVSELAGRGLKGSYEGRTVLCGNAKLLEENGISFEPVQSEDTIVYVALDGAYAGFVAIGDTIRPESPEAIAALKAEGIDYTVMLTGDSSGRAENIAWKTGLDECMAGLLPNQKLEAAEKLKERGKLLYVGDGINDAPVMTTADCSVSMGKVGSDAAIEASDLVLISDKLSLIAKGRKIAKKTRTIMFENIIGSLVIKLAIMILALCISNFPLIIAIVADVGVMLLAVLNALRASFAARK